jgi:hypothetical protein
MLVSASHLLSFENSQASNMAETHPMGLPACSYLIWLVGIKYSMILSGRRIYDILACSLSTVIHPKVCAFFFSDYIVARFDVSRNSSCTCPQIYLLTYFGHYQTVRVAVCKDQLIGKSNY